MKKLIVIALAAVFAIPMFNACKKGENDPTLSLKSRKARLTGEWNLKTGTITVSSGGQSVTQMMTPPIYNLKIEIDKNHTYTSTTTYTQGTVSSTSIEKGTWSFGRKDKELELKNKEYVIFKVTQETAGSSVRTYTGTECPTYFYMIDQLKNKEMIVKIEGTSTSGSGTSTTTGTITFEKK